MTSDVRGSPTAEPVFMHERASATPVTPSPSRGSVALPSRFAVGFLDTSLRAQQTWLAAAITTPEAEALPVAAAEANVRLTAGPRASAMDRLQVYRRAYHARLVECLLDDYPAVQATVGEGAFDALCRKYIAARPSNGPNLNVYGKGFSDFCRHETAAIPPRTPCVFVSELAALEWAIVEVIHAPTSEPLTLGGLATLPVERWAGARLVPTQASRLLGFEYPVNDYFQAFRQGEEPQVPEKAAAAVVVYRSGPTLWRMNLTETMATLLSALREGSTLGEAIDRSVDGFRGEAEDVVAGRVMAWFRDWVSSGLFARIDL